VLELYKFFQSVTFVYI